MDTEIISVSVNTKLIDQQDKFLQQQYCDFNSCLQNQTFRRNRENKKKVNVEHE